MANECNMLADIYTSPKDISHSTSSSSSAIFPFCQHQNTVRFEQYFGWWDDYSVLTNTTINYCHYKKISDGNHLGSTPTKDADAAAILAARNWADMELFMYAKHQLFPAQAALVA